MKIPQEIACRLVWEQAKDEVSAPPTLKEITPIWIECEDCGKTCSSNRQIKSVLNSTPFPHWKHSCSECKNIRHPDTGEFSIPYQGYRSTFNQIKQQKDK